MKQDFSIKYKNGNFKVKATDANAAMLALSMIADSDIPVKSMELSNGSKEGKKAKKYPPTKQRTRKSLTPGAKALQKRKARALALRAKGHRVATIAAKLGVHENTVYKYISSEI